MERRGTRGHSAKKLPHAKPTCVRHTHAPAAISANHGDLWRKPPPAAADGFDPGSSGRRSMHPCARARCFRAVLSPRRAPTPPRRDSRSAFSFFISATAYRRVDAAMSKAPIKVGVTGAAGQIAYSLLPNLVSGAVFGQDQPVILSLLDIPPAQTALSGVVMEM